eukprot:4311904-Pyramimonas_sp.AAC.1
MAPPTRTRQRGLILDRAECDDFGAALLREDTPLPPPPRRGDQEERTLAESGFIVVAGDGACPGQASDLRFRRNGHALHCGPDRVMNANMPLASVAPRARRAE